MVISYRPLSFLLPLSLLCLFSWITYQSLHSNTDTHRILQTDISLTSTLPRLDFSKPDRSHRDFYASEAAHDFCAAHAYSVFQPSQDAPDGRRKIYDLFMVNSELDFLEIRLKTLYDYVDYFVVVEAPLTFQGGPKNLTIRNNWDRFKPYHKKMIYHELVYPEGFNPVSPWDREDLQRNAMFEQVFPKMTGLQAPVKGDVLLVADVDEIPRPATLLVLRTCNFPRRLTLSSRFYYYSFQFLHAGAEWEHPQATFYQGMDQTLRPKNLRGGDGGIPLVRTLEMGTLSNAAWHCSSCFETIEQFLNKMSSFSHELMNQDYFRDRHRIANAVRKGVDLWNRETDIFIRLDNVVDVPSGLLAEKDKFRYMLNRDGETAGFIDYP